MTRGTIFAGGGYGWVIQPSLPKAAKAWRKSIRKLIEEQKIDALAFSGSSGSAAAFSIGSYIKIPLIYVRKPEEVSHGRAIECNMYEPISRYLIVDDFVCSGKTIKYIYRKIEEYSRSFKNDIRCAGVWLYDDSGEFAGDTIEVKKDIHLPVFLHE